MIVMIVMCNDVKSQKAITAYFQLLLFGSARQYNYRSGLVNGVGRGAEISQIRFFYQSYATNNNFATQ